jgi:hypothetical protein
LRAASWLIYDQYEFREDGSDVYVYAPTWSVGDAEPEMLHAYEMRRKELESSYPDNPELAWELAARSFRVYRPNNVKQRYAPLNYSDTFLLFSRLAEGGPITKEVMAEWVEAYGVLGLQKKANGWGDPRGGPAESLSTFVSHAQDANFVLRLYEAATLPDGPNVEYLRERVVAREPTEQYGGEKTSPKELRKLALAYVARTVHQQVSGECFPLLFRRKDGSFLQGWGFKSLLGAMYVQLMWLMTATGESVRRCLWCHNVITFRQPEQPSDAGLKKNVRGKYRTRSDRIFCDNDDKCKGAYNYHNVQKPSKQAESS